MKKDETGKYWLDENGNNKWSVKYFTEEEAERLSKTLIDCEDCTNCGSCTDCKKCVGCYYSIDCYDCRHCYHCSGCEHDQGCCFCSSIHNSDYVAFKSQLQRYTCPSVNMIGTPKGLTGALQNYVNRLNEKAKEYATEKDRYHNFKLAGELQGISPEKALIGMMSKHIVSVYDMVNSEEKYSVEEWDEKIGDSINYLLLLRGMVMSDV